MKMCITFICPKEIKLNCACSDNNTEYKKINCFAKLKWRWTHKKWISCELVNALFCPQFFTVPFSLIAIRLLLFEREKAIKWLKLSTLTWKNVYLSTSHPEKKMKMLRILWIFIWGVKCCENIFLFNFQEIFTLYKSSLNKAGTNNFPSIFKTFSTQESTFPSSFSHDSPKLKILHHFHSWVIKEKFSLYFSTLCYLKILSSFSFPAMIQFTIDIKARSMTFFTVKISDTPWW